VKPLQQARYDKFQVDVIFIPSQHPHSEDPWHDFGTISAQKISTGVDAGKAREGQEPQERGRELQALERKRKKARSFDRALIFFWSGKRDSNSRLQPWQNESLCSMEGLK
jgi:hypothetical protein